jgi:predicted transcriptional regulator
MTKRITVTLDDEHAAKLAHLAEHSHMDEGSLAAWLLSSALDDANRRPERMVALLDGIDGAHERVQRAREQARRGATIELDDL